MAQQQQNIPLASPAFQGVNTEDSPLTQDPTFASRANNAVIDDLGRIGARKGFFEYTTSVDFTNVTQYSGSYDATVITVGPLSHNEGSNPVCIAKVSFQLAGVEQAAEQYVCEVDGAVLRPMTHSAAALTVASQTQAMRPQIVSFAGQYFIFVQGNSALEVSGTSVTRLRDGAGFLPPQDDSGNLTSGDITGGVACSAYGRLWVTGVGANYQQIWYSDLQDARVWYDGKAVPTDSLNTGGAIDVEQYWPAGRDQIKAIVAHNNGLVVFGRNSILLYGNPQGDPAAIGGLFLQDTIEGMGLVSRDALCATGADLLFLDDTGVRSLGRTIQEQSAPVGDLTLNVRSDITRKIRATADLDTVSLSYWVHEGFAVCNFSDEGFAYVIDVRKPSSTGGARITTWTECPFDRSVAVNEGSDNLILMGGKEANAVLRYFGSVDAGTQPYHFEYQSTLLSFGDSTRQKFPKRIDITTITKDAETSATVRWGYEGRLEYSKALTIDAIVPAFYGTALFGEDSFGSAETTIKRYRANTKGSGALVSVGVDATINGGSFSLQELNLQLLLGRLY